MKRCKTHRCSNIVALKDGRGRKKDYCDTCAKDRIKARHLAYNRVRNARLKKEAETPIWKEKPDWMCTAWECDRKKGKGMRYLCDECYHGEENDVDFEHLVNSHDATVGAF